MYPATSLLGLEPFSMRKERARLDRISPITGAKAWLGRRPNGSSAQIALSLVPFPSALLGAVTGARAEARQQSATQLTKQWKQLGLVSPYHTVRVIEAPVRPRSTRITAALHSPTGAPSRRLNLRCGLTTLRLRFYISRIMVLSFPANSSLPGCVTLTARNPAYP